MCSPTTAPALINASPPQEFDEETRLMEKRHLEVFESFAKFGFNFFCFAALFLVFAWKTNLLNSVRMRQLVYLTLVGFLSFLMAKKMMIIHRHRHRGGMGFKIVVILGVWMHSAFMLDALTVDLWPGFQFFILGVTAFLVVLPAVFMLKFHRQQMDARRQRREQIMLRRSRRI